MIGMAIAQAPRRGRARSARRTWAPASTPGIPGYIDYTPVFKNIPAFWTETQGTGRGAARVHARGRSRRDMRRPQALYASPWLGGTWRLRDAVEYMHTASIATLDYAAKYKDALLYNRYQAGRDQIARGRSEAPYAYVVPQDQRDPVAAVEMLRRLAFGGVRVSQLTAPATIDGETFPAGHLGDADRSGVRGARARSARRAEVSGDPRVARRSARHAVRRRRLDAAALDGRARRRGHDAAAPTMCGRS